MIAPTICPTDELLVAYGLGKISDADGETVMTHLERCDGCRQRVAEMSGDSFVGRLKAAQRGTSLPDKSFAGLATSVGGPGVKASGLPPELANHPDYADVRELGRGGMGVVYLAQHRLMKRWEVLKVVGKEQLASRGAADRFLQEVQSAARLNHPNVVKAYSASRLGEMIAFSMEYVPGDDLAKVVKARGPLSVQHASFYAAQVAMGLQHAHDKGMVHRDIKPANLMLTKDGTKSVVKILDFGLAKVTSEQKVDTGLTRVGTMMGTPDFMAPEQWKDAATADTRADIYSLGCTLYYLLAGHPPFLGADIWDLHRKHETQTAKPLNLERPEVPPELAAVVAKMLAKEPGKRYQTPGEVAAALKPFVVTAPPVKPAEVSRFGSITSKPKSTVPPPPVAVPLPPAPEVAPDADVWKTLCIEKSPQTALKVKPRPATKPVRRRPFLWPAVATAIVVIAAVVTMASTGVFVKTKDGTIELTDLPPDADVFVDGGKATVTWDAGKQRAEVRVKPGTRKLEVKRGETTVIGETVEIESGGRKVLAAKLTEVAKPNDLPKAEQAKWLPLFNGKDLTGWKTHSSQSGDWRVENGILTGSGPRANGLTSHLYTERDDYTDFRLRAECRINNGGNSGLHARTRFGPEVPAARPRFLSSGYEAQINSTHSDVNKTGSLYVGGSGVAVGVKESPVPHDQWFTMEVIAEGNHITVKVNDKVTADFTDDQRRFDKGHIALQQHNPETACEFRKIEIKELRLTNGPIKVGDVLIAELRKVHDNRTGEWFKDGSELAQVSNQVPDSRLCFGDLTWTDYDYQVDVMKDGGRGEIGIFYRVTADQGGVFTVGKYDRTWESGVTLFFNGRKDKRLQERQTSAIDSGRWYAMRVRVRGAHVRCYLADRLALDYQDDENQKGAVGLWTWQTAARFRNIRVTDPDGTVLWEGLPELPK